MAVVPHTLTRLSQSLGLLSVQQMSPKGVLPDLNQSLFGAITDLSTFALSASTIGGCSGFTVRQSRTNIRRYGINSPMEPFAVVPGPITTTLELKMAVLYIQDAMQAFNFSPGNIANQTRPLIIQEIPQAPDVPIPTLLRQAINKTAGLKPDMIAQIEKKVNKIPGSKLSDWPIMNYYVGCWLAEGGIQYGLEDNQMVMTDLRFDVAMVVDPTILEAVVTKGLQRLLNKIPLVNTVSRFVTTSPVGRQISKVAGLK